MLVKRQNLTRHQMYQKYTPDLLRDPFYRFLERHVVWLWIFVIHAALFFLGGFLVGWASTSTLIGGLQLGLSMFVWGVIVRLVYSWHATWAVNSIGHLWGYRNYDTADNSRNNWLVTLITNGGGWHNNHHGDPRSAAHGHHRWWEIDLVYLTIRFLQMVGLARQVIQPHSHARSRTAESALLQSAFHQIVLRRVLFQLGTDLISGSF